MLESTIVESSCIIFDATMQTVSFLHRRRKTLASHDSISSSFILEKQPVDHLSNYKVSCSILIVRSEPSWSQFTQLKAIVQGIVDELTETGLSPQLLRGAISRNVNGDSSDCQETGIDDNHTPETTQEMNNPVPEINNIVCWSAQRWCTSWSRSWVNLCPSCEFGIKQQPSAVGKCQWSL